MLIHHIATLSLITGSYVFNYIPIGTLVMVVRLSTHLPTHPPNPYITVARSNRLVLLHLPNNVPPTKTTKQQVHDAADSLLELAKLFNYVSNVHKWAQAITDACFIAFAVVFGITRCFLFPYYIIHNTFTEPQRHPQHLYKANVSVGILNGFLCVLVRIRSPTHPPTHPLTHPLTHPPTALSPYLLDVPNPQNGCENDGQWGGDQRRPFGG